MKLYVFTPLLFTLVFSVLQMSCKQTSEPPVVPLPDRIVLTLIDVSVTKSYLHVSVTNPASNETVALQRNGATVLAFAAVAETTIADTALAQSTAYQYTATLVASNLRTGTSNTVSAQTLAPTSHNFTWQTFLLGDGNGSALYDIALINDTLAYAVGEIYLSGDPTPYNIAKWNGEQWALQKLTYQGYPPVIHFVFAVNANDIWFDPWFHWDGQQFNELPIDRIFIGNRWHRMWGVGNTLFVVGNGGAIVYSADHGSTWHRIESGTTTSILDAWGVVNPVTSREEVYCVASNIFGNGDTKILKITGGTTVDSLQWIDRLLTGVWTNSGFPLYTSGDGVFENTRGEWREVPTGIYTNDIRGTSLNNIVAVGDFGFITHFNGIDWQVVGSDATAGYATVRVRNSLVVAVGRKNAQGLITLGRRH